MTRLGPQRGNSMHFGPINLWSLPKQLRDYMYYRQEQLMDIDLSKGEKVSDHAKAMTQAGQREFKRYFKDVSNLKEIDVYMVLELFEIKSHAVGHAIKKLLVAGGRGAKDEKQDVCEAIAALKRYLEILEGK